MRIDVPYIQVTLHLLQAWLPKNETCFIHYNVPLHGRGKFCYEDS